jgi:hypothetical protein
MTLFLSKVLTALYTHLFMFHTMNHYIEKIVLSDDHS